MEGSVPREKLTVPQLVKNFPAFTTARHLSLSWTCQINSVPAPFYFMKIRFNNVPHLRVGLASGLFSEVFLPRACTHIYCHPYILHVPPISPVFFSHSNNIWWEVQIMKFFIMLSSTLIPAFLFNLGPNFFLSALFSNTFTLCPSLNLLKPTGHVMHQQFNIQQLYVLPTLYLCVLYLSENKQRLVPLTP